MARRTLLVGLLVVVGLAVARPPRAETWAANGEPPPLTTCYGHEPTVQSDGSGVIYGTGWPDVIVSADQVVETIYGFGGDDTICANVDDVVYAGSGNDFVDGFQGSCCAAVIAGESGNDWLIFADVLRGDTGDDTLIFGENLFGGPGNDSLTGLGGSSHCDGGSGRDQATDCGSTRSVP
jgi:Ca2+-binding RTX toxin-like protein